LWEPEELGVNVHVELVALGTAVPSRYHWKLNGEVPPVTVERNDCDCPMSMVTELGVTRIESGPFTVTVTLLDVATALAESMTFK
jgi:hypothetical protein